eukprot:gene7132-9733_t
MESLDVIDGQEAVHHLLLQMNQKQLSLRTHAVNTLRSKTTVNPSSNEISSHIDGSQTLVLKVGVYKRIFRAIVGALLDRYYYEQVWVNILTDYLIEIVQCIVKQFDGIDFVCEYLIELGSNSKLSGCSSNYRVNLICVSCKLLQIRVPYSKIHIVNILSFISTQYDFLSDAIIYTSQKEFKHASHYLQELVSEERKASDGSNYEIIKETLIQISAKSICVSSLLYRFYGNLTIGKYSQQKDKDDYATLLPQLKNNILDNYKKKISVTTKTNVLHNSIAIYIAVTTISDSDWSDNSTTVNAESLQSYSIKLMKKAPEGSSSCIAFLTKNAKVCLDGFISLGGFVSVIRMLKSGDEQIRQSGMTILKSATIKCYDPNSYKIMMDQLIEAIQGKGSFGTLTQPYQKPHLVVGLKICSLKSKSIGRDYAVSLVNDLLPVLIPLIEKEVDDNCRSLYAGIVGYFLSNLPPTSLDKLPVALSQFVASAKTSIEKNSISSLSVCYLYAISIALRLNPDITVCLTQLVTTVLIGVVKESSKRGASVLTLDVVLSSRIILEMMQISSEIASAVNTAKLLNLILISNSSSVRSPSILFTRNLINNIISINYKTEVISFEKNAGHIIDLAVDSLNGNENINLEVIQSICYCLVSLSSNYSQQFLEFMSQTIENDTSDGVRFLLSLILHDNSLLRAVGSNTLISLINNIPTLGEIIMNNLWVLTNALGEYQEKQIVDGKMNYKTNSSAVGDDSVAPVVDMTKKWKFSISETNGYLCFLNKMPSNNVLVSAVSEILSAFNKALFSSGLIVPNAVIHSIVSHAILLNCNPLFCDNSFKKCVQNWKSFEILLLKLTENYIRMENKKEETNGNLSIVFENKFFHMIEGKKEIYQINIQNMKMVIYLLANFSFETKSISSSDQRSSIMRSSIINIFPELSPDNILIKFILPHLITLMQSDEFNSLSSNDIETYLNPQKATKLAIESFQSSSNNNNNTEIKVTNADRKKTTARSSRKGTFGADVADDEDWAERLKREKALKMTQSKLAEESVAEVRIASEVDTVYQKVKEVVDKIKSSLDLLGMFAHVKSSILQRDVLPQIFEPILTKLLASKLTSESAVICLTEISSKCIEEELLSVLSDLIQSIRISVNSLNGIIEENGEAISESTSQQNFQYIINFSGPIVRLISRLYSFATHSKIGQNHLLPCTFHLIFPVLRAILSLSATIPGCEVAFFLLDSFWPQSSVFLAAKGDNNFVEGSSTLRILQKMVIEVVMKSLTKPKLEPNPEKVFLRVTTQLLPLLSSEWIPILEGFLSNEVKVRMSCLKAVIIMTTAGINLCDGLNPLLESRLWLSRFDEDELIRQESDQMWSDFKLQLNCDYTSLLLPLLNHGDLHVREAAAKALGAAIGNLNSRSREATDQLQILFIEKSPVKTTSTKNSSIAIPLKGIIPTKKPTKDALKPSALFGNNNSTKAPIASIEAIDMPVRQAIFEDANFPLRLAISQIIIAVGVQNSQNAEKSPSLSVSESEMIVSLFKFVLDCGVIDNHTDVRNSMLLAGRSLIDRFGMELRDIIRETLEEILGRKAVSKDNVIEYDYRHGAAVVLLGACAKHLSKDDPNILTIIESLVDALATPSESVQRSVAECLTPLVQLLKANEKIIVLLEKLINWTLEGNTYGERRGAAFGLSAFVKGLGIPCLKQYDIVNRLKESCTNGSVNNRQGSLFAFECLSERLGLLFEPYIITIVPILLKSFSHSSDHVREAAQGTAKVIMSKLSAHGVKQVLNPILQSLPEETAWKTRQEAIRLLGMMAHCAPRQLSSCLPQIVPRLVEAGSDPHPKVKESAKNAMLDISSVIKNPEVSRLSPILLNALSDPSNKTKDALESLLQCEFMHSIDAPSLALLIPILGRALRDRGADVKRKSAAITGNIMTMISDSKTIAPYLPQVLPGLKDCLLDPIPDVRATSAKALGSLVSGVGEEDLDELLPWLTTTLSTEVGPVERSGAAQGLAEICHSLSLTRVREILQDVLKYHNHPQSAGREGLLWFMSFLPVSLNEAFSEYISITLPIILSGLSDDSEGVREVAMRAGQVMVSKMGFQHTGLLLPSLTVGMFNDDWRIRLSSVKLLSELLYLVGDVKPIGLIDGDDEDDDGGGFNSASNSRVAVTIRAHVGGKETDTVLASLYIARSDISITVRQAALQLWKSVVNNTPRTLVEIMPILVKILIDNLSSDSEELRIITGRALGELVKKLGDKILPAVVPHLRANLSNSSESIRHGICTGLTEILSVCTRKQAEDYIDILVPALQMALCDKSIDVCAQAARAFMTLFKVVGNQAIDEVVPSLLNNLADGGDDGELALRGLREIVSLRPRDLIEYLLPIFMTSPIQIVSAKALGCVAEVTSNQMNQHYSQVIPGLVHELMITQDRVDQLSTALKDCESSDCKGSRVDEFTEDLEKETLRFIAVKDASISIMASVVSTSLSSFVSELGKQIEHETNVKRRRWACWLTEQFVLKSKADFRGFMPVLLKYILSRVAELDSLLLQSVRDVLNAISTSVSLDETMNHLEFIRNCISSTASAARHKTGNANLLTETGEFLLPILTIQKGLDPFITICLHGLMNGSIQIRASAADAIAELVQMSDVNILKPMLIKTTGPLIRVIGDRFPSNVKASILQALCVLLDKGGISLKAFIPQLQTTFIKSLNDPSREVRIKGATALGKIMPLSPKIDALLTELSNICTQAESNAIKASVLEALFQVMQQGGDKASVASLDKVKVAVMENMVDEDETLRFGASKCLGSTAAFYSESIHITDMLLDLIGNSKMSTKNSSHWSKQAGRLTAICSILNTAGMKAVEMREEAFDIIMSGLKDDRAAVRAAACRSVSILISIPKFVGSESRKPEYRSCSQTVIHTFASQLASNAAVSSSSVQDGNNEDVRANAINTIKEAAKNFYGATAQHFKEFLPPLVASLREISLRVKYAAERALKHLCEGPQVGSSATALSQAMTNFLNAANSSTDADVARNLRDYYKRILNNLAEDSENDDVAIDH